MILKSANPLECMRSIFSLEKFTDLLKVLRKIDPGSQTKFTPLEQLYLNWKASKRTFEKISKEESKGKDLEQDLFETDYNIEFDHSLVYSEKTTKGLTDKVSQTVGFNNTQENELKRLKRSVRELRESYDKYMRSYFTDNVISSNKQCNHYTGFSSVDVLNTVFEYLDHGINSENVILYNYQKTKNDSSTAGRPKNLNPFKSS